MSPIQDPRFSHAHKSQMRQQDRDAGERAARMEYIKPTVMLLLGGGIVVGSVLSSGSAGSALLYVLVLSVELIVGVAGLWAASAIWLGGMGPLGLGILRLAGIYAMTDMIALFLGELAFVGLLIQLVCYVAMLAWLFELDPAESILLAILTFVLKIVAGFAIAIVLAGVM
ncbi:MAG: hypothetical protein IIB53_12690 [Planctomycetes bacterium]|nr:hypothetical protein [Planctomycetota bacterium]